MKIYGDEEKTKTDHKIAHNTQTHFHRQNKAIQITLSYFTFFGKENNAIVLSSKQKVNDSMANAK